VLSEDYFTAPAERIPAIRSELTVVGGRVVHSAGAFAPELEPAG
jgi:predicted amidohydrolase YtcJ